MKGATAAGVGVALVACQAKGGEGRREFDGQRAFTYVTDQMKFGARIPGTPPHEQEGDWLLTQLRARADTVVVQSIDHLTRRGDTLHLRNFLARFKPQAAERILYLAHWDTRPTADQAAPALRHQPVPGADDAASDVAVLLGVSDALKLAAPTVVVYLLFEDGCDNRDFAQSHSLLIAS